MYNLTIEGRSWRVRIVVSVELACVRLAHGASSDACSKAAPPVGGGSSNSPWQAWVYLARLPVSPSVRNNGATSAASVAQLQSFPLNKHVCSFSTRMKKLPQNLSLVLSAKASGRLAFVVDFPFWISNDFIRQLPKYRQRQDLKANRKGFVLVFRHRSSIINPLASQLVGRPHRVEYIDSH